MQPLPKASTVPVCQRRLHSSPFLPCKDHIRGFVYDVTDGKLHEVELPSHVP